MLPVEESAARAEVLRHATEPKSFESLSAQEIEAKGSAWVQRFTRTVLK
jgi:ABC-type thiamine transport system substrate-binding protein